MQNASYPFNYADYSAELTMQGEQPRPPVQMEIPAGERILMQISFLGESLSFIARFNFLPFARGGELFLFNLRSESKQASERGESEGIAWRGDKKLFSFL
jgi:hypothetical protein